MRMSSQLVAMSRLPLTAGLAVVALLVPLAGLPLAAAARQPIPGISSVLHAGHRLTANRDGQGPHAELASPSGVFQLRLQGASLSLDENETFPDGFGVGTTNWWQFLVPKHGNFIPFNKATLRMQTDGNLVMYTSKGKVIWASHTRGTGSRNSLHVLNNGNLVIDTASGKPVWSSRTTPTFLLAGHSLSSGMRMINRYRQQFGIAITRLVMKADGDLVIYWGKRVTWSTHTHVPGAHVSLTRGGDLVVRAPSGRVLWRSRTRGHDAFLEVNQCGQINISARNTNGPGWNAPPGPQRSCG
jgi:D-mannose binding lectin